MSVLAKRFVLVVVAVSVGAGCIQNPDDLDATGADAGEPREDANQNGEDANGQPDDAQAPDDTGPSCPGTQTLCEDPDDDGTKMCVDIDTDPDHCGECANRCESDATTVGVCEAGECTTECDLAAGFADCEGDGECVDLNTDADHCGGCDHSCATGECANGRCAPHDCNPDTEPFGGGEGTATNPFTICSPEQLAAIPHPTVSAAYYALSDDIDLTGVDWQPPGWFEGQLDGFGFTIRNLEWTDGGANTGLFREIAHGGRVEDLTIENFAIANNNPDAHPATGAVTGTNHGTISEVDVIESEITAPQRTGGIAGEHRGEIARANVENSTIEGNTHVGAIAGSIFGGFVGDSHASDVSLAATTGEIGGLAGRVSNWGHVTDSSASTTIERPDDVAGENTNISQAGGFIGLIHGGGIVARSYANADISDDLSVSTAGGLVGRIDNPHATVIDCYATGDVGDVAAQQTGAGLIGELHGQLTNCYTLAATHGEGTTGGLVAAVDPNPAVTGEDLVDSSFWHVDHTGQDESAGGSPLQTDTFGNTDFFNDVQWDLDSVWTISDDGEDFDFARPRLQWELD